MNFDEYQRVDYQGNRYVMVPERDAETRQLGMFNPSVGYQSAILDPRSRVPGPWNWSKIGMTDVVNVEPRPPGTQPGFPEMYPIVAPGGLDWSVTIQPTGQVFYLGLRVTCQAVLATVDVETGAWTWDDFAPVREVPCAAVIAKGSNTDIVTGGEDTGTDLGGVTIGGPDFVLVHGVSQENPFHISGKVLPATNHYQIVRVTAYILAQPSDGIEIKPMLQLATKDIDEQGYKALMQSLKAKVAADNA